MSDRDIGQEILDGIREIKRFKKGEIKAVDLCGCKATHLCGCKATQR